MAVITKQASSQLLASTGWLVWTNPSHMIIWWWFAPIGSTIFTIILITVWHFCFNVMLRVRRSGTRKRMPVVWWHIGTRKRMSMHGNRRNRVCVSWNVWMVSMARNKDLVIGREFLQHRFWICKQISSRRPREYNDMLQVWTNPPDDCLWFGHTRGVS